MYVITHKPEENQINKLTAPVRGRIHLVCCKLSWPHLTNHKTPPNNFDLII